MRQVARRDRSSANAIQSASSKRTIMLSLLSLPLTALNGTVLAASVWDSCMMDYLAYFPEP